MSRLTIAPLSVLFLAVGVYAAILNFTFTVTNASVTTSGTGVSVSGPATLTVSGVSPDTGTFSASGSLANISGGNVTVPFTVTLGHGTITGTMTFPETVLVSSGPVSGSATITGGTGRYADYTSTTVTASGLTGSVLSGGMLSFSISGTVDTTKNFTFTVTNAPVTISGTSVFSGPASLTLAGGSPDTGTFSASGSLTNISGGNVTVPFTVTLDSGTITGTMTFPETALVSSGPVSGSATITGGTGSYAGYTSSTLTASGTLTGSVLSGGMFSFSISGTVNTNGGGGPVISSVVNAATWIPPGLPNAGIAQGSIFVVSGSNLGPASIVIASPAFQTTSLGGTSVYVTVGDTMVEAPLYYSLAGYVAALLPSNTPVGEGTVVVTYNGLTSGNAFPVTVVENNLGIFTVTSDGQGAGIVTYPDYSLVSTTKAANCGGVYTTCGAANPGDVLIIWATGLGPISGSDASGDGLGVYMPSIPLTIWLGGVPIQASYQGRSGCCIGEDQIVFKVPANVPTGCAVPLSVQINNFISNSVAMPVAPAGSRTCTPTNPAFTTANVVQLSSGNGSYTFGSISLKRQDDYPSFPDVVKGQFASFTIASNVQPFFFSYLDVPALGSCQIFDNPNGNVETPVTSQGLLDAGPQLTVQGPNGSQNASLNGNFYQATLSANGGFFSPGTITVSAPGGANVPSFSTSVTLPVLPTMTSPPPDPANAFSVTRSSGLTVSWSGGAANEYIVLIGASATDNTYSVGTFFECVSPASAGSFVIPPSVLLALPPGNFGGMDFSPTLAPVSLTGTGLDITELTLQYAYHTPLTFK